MLYPCLLAVLSSSSPALHFPAGPVQTHETGSTATETRVGDRIVLDGYVLLPDGNPCEGAVVVSSAGGAATTDATGRYRLAIEVPRSADEVRITAVGGPGGRLSAGASIALPPSRGAWLRPAPVRLAGGPPCSPDWLPTFGGAPGVSGEVRALVVHDDGSGPALFVGGSFTFAAGTATTGIARWDGSTWSDVGGGMNGTVHTLVAYDDGSGPTLVAGGLFTAAGGVAADHIASWDGSSWTALGTGMNAEVNALEVLDDGSGPALYAGGLFTTAGGTSAAHVARWDGSVWSPLGSGLDQRAYALAAFDDGSGPALFAGGNFTSAGGAAANRIARWDGSTWAPLGTGMDAAVLALAVHDDGGGPALYAGGSFSSAGGIAASCIARWDGVQWQPLGGGLGGVPAAAVLALGVRDEGSGEVLYAGGTFATAGGSPARKIARWDGLAWSAAGSGFELDDAFHVRAIAVHDDGSGDALVLGGLFEWLDGKVVRHVARYRGAEWSPLGDGLVGEVRCMTIHDDGSGPALFVGGEFSIGGDIARWDGAGWAALGSGIPGIVRSLVVHDDGTGAALYAGGSFLTAGGQPASRIARWNGSEWSAVGGGTNNTIEALCVHDDGSGPALYVGGSFTSAGGIPASRVARWDGTSWAALGAGASGTVFTLAVHDDGAGAALFAGGSFAQAGGAAAGRIARWRNGAWSPLGSGFASFTHVFALCEHDDGTGPALFVGGSFQSAGGVPAERIAKWDGVGWSALGSGADGNVLALAVHDDGTGPGLYAAGAFTAAGGVAASRIARWDGSAWSPVGSGASPYEIRALLSGSLEGTPALLAGGAFLRIGESGDSLVGRWACPVDVEPPEITCPPSLAAADGLADGPGEIVHFTVTATDDFDSMPSVVCSPPSGTRFPRGTTLVQCTATDAAGNESACSFEVTVHTKWRRR